MNKEEFTTKFDSLERDLEDGYYYGIAELLEKVENFISFDSAFGNLDYNVTIVLDDGFLELSNVRQNFYYAFLSDVPACDIIDFI